MIYPSEDCGGGGGGGGGGSLRSWRNRPHILENFPSIRSANSGTFLRRWFSRSCGGFSSVKGARESSCEAGQTEGCGWRCARSEGARGTGGVSSICCEQMSDCSLAQAAGACPRGAVSEMLKYWIRRHELVSSACRRRG